MVSTGTSRWLTVGKCRLGLVDPVAIEKRIEVAVAEALVDDLSQPMLRQVEPGREHGDGEAFLTVDALHGHQTVEATQQDGCDGIAASIGTRHGLSAAGVVRRSIHCRRRDRKNGRRRIKQAPSDQSRHGQQTDRAGKASKNAGDTGRSRYQMRAGQQANEQQRRRHDREPHPAPASNQIGTPGSDRLYGS